MHNYYKSFNKNKTFLLNGVFNIIILTISIIICVNLSSNVILIALVTILTQFLWFITSDLLLRKKVDFILIKHIIYIIFISLGFYFTNIIGNSLLKIIVYLLYYLILTVSLYFREIRDKVFEVKSNLSKKKEVRMKNDE